MTHWLDGGHRALFAHPLSGLEAACRFAAAASARRSPALSGADRPTRLPTRRLLLATVAVAVAVCLVAGSGMHPAASNACVSDGTADGAYPQGQSAPHECARDVAANSVG